MSGRGKGRIEEGCGGAVWEREGGWRALSALSLHSGASPKSYPSSDNDRKCWTYGCPSLYIFFILS